MDMNEIKEIFFQECEEQLAELESGLLRLNDGDTDPETVNAVFRAVHSIKGGAGAFGLDDLVSFAHVFETTLDCVRSNKLEASPDLLKVMLRSADVLADLTAASRDGGTVESSRTSGLVAELEAYAKGQPLPNSAAAPAAAAPEPAKSEWPLGVHGSLQAPLRSLCERQRGGPHSARTRQARRPAGSVRDRRSAFARHARPGRRLFLLADPG